AGKKMRGLVRSPRESCSRSSGLTSCGSFVLTVGGRPVPGAGRPDANRGRGALHPDGGHRPWQAWTMSATSEAMNRIVVNIVRLARRPGLVLLVAAAVPVGVFLLFGLLIGLDAVSWVGCVPCALAVLLAVPVVVLAVRRARGPRATAARWFPRVEAAQRALLRAAGGPVNAPYLRDDLRVTLLAFLGTVAAIPLGVLGAFVCAFALLLG